MKLNETFGPLVVPKIVCKTNKNIVEKPIDSFINQDLGKKKKS